MTSAPRSSLFPARLVTISQNRTWEQSGPCDPAGESRLAGDDLDELSDADFETAPEIHGFWLVLSQGRKHNSASGIAAPGGEGAGTPEQALDRTIQLARRRIADQEDGRSHHVIWIPQSP